MSTQLRAFFVAVPRELQPVRSEAPVAQRTAKQREESVQINATQRVYTQQTLEAVLRCTDTS